MVDKKHIAYLIAFLSIGLVCFLKADMGSEFSWMAFQERDLSKAALFLNTGFLDPLGPEVSKGGHLPGPFLTVVLSVTLYIAGNIAGVFYLTQLLILATLVIVFDLTREKLGIRTALIFAFVFSASSNFFLYSYAAWHAAFAPFFVSLTIWLGNKAFQRGSSLIWLLTGFVAGVGIQIHGTSIFPPVLALIVLGACHPKNVLRAIPVIFTGLFLSLGYYLYNELLNDFANTRSLLATSSLHFYNDPNFLAYLRNKYLYFSALNILPGDSLIGNLNSQFELHEHNLHSLDFPAISYFVQAGLVLTGVLALSRRPKSIPIVGFLILVISIPMLQMRPEARFHMFSAIGWPLLLSAGIHTLFFEIRLKATLRIIAGFVGLSVVGLSLVTNPASVSQHTIYYKSSSGYLYVTKALIRDLNLKPDDYENSFYFYRGQGIWPFWTNIPLPSRHTYRYLFDEAALDEVRDLGDNGIILLEKKDRPDITLSHVEIIREIEIGNFIAIIYASPYLYRMIPQYSDTETVLAATNSNATTSQRTEGLWTTSQDFVIKTQAQEDLRFLVNFGLRETSAGLTGFAEIQSQKLRQSGLAEQSPYFIVNPVIALHTKDNRKFSFPLLDEHLYSNQKIKPYGDTYDLLGKVSESKFLGSFYVEAPYGRPITLGGLEFGDIARIELLVESYGDVNKSRIVQIGRSWPLQLPDTDFNASKRLN